MLAEIGCNVADVVPTSTDTAAALFERFDVVVMGGTKPGHTTDAVSVAFARDSGAANVIIATNVSHVYTADPRTNDDAEPIDMLTLSELQDITGKEVLPLVKALLLTLLPFNGRLSAG